MTFEDLGKNSAVRTDARCESVGVAPATRQCGRQRAALKITDLERINWKMQVSLVYVAPVEGHEHVVGKRHKRPRTRRQQVGRTGARPPTTRIGRRPSSPETNSMAGRVCAYKEGLLLHNCPHHHQSVNAPKRPSNEEEEHKGARLGGLVGECWVIRIRWPASRRVGCPPVLGLVARQF